MTDFIDEENDAFIQSDDCEMLDSSPIDASFGLNAPLLNAQQMFQTILDDFMAASLDDPDREQALRNFGKYIKRSCITAYPAVFRSIFSDPPTRESK